MTRISESSHREHAPLLRNLKTPPLTGVGILLALVSGCLAACSSSGGGSADPFAERSVGLLAFDDCNDLLDYLRAETLTDIEFALSRGYSRGWDEDGMDIAVGMPEDRSGSGATPAPQAANDSTGELGGGNGVGGASDSPEYSRTNNQEQGVDEPDIVKTDGHRIYVVRNDLLLIYDAQDLALQSQTPLVGNSHLLLISEDKAVVISDAWRAPDEGFDVDEEMLERSSKTTVSVYDIGDAAAPTLIRRAYVEGRLEAARLIGQSVHLAVHFNPILDASMFADISMPNGNVSDTTEPQPIPSPPPDIQEPEWTDGGVDGEDRPPVEEPDAGAGPDDGGEIDPADERDGGVDEAGSGEFEPKRDPDPGPADDPATEQQALDAIRERLAELPIETWLPQVFDAAGDDLNAGHAVTCGNFYRPGERAGNGVTVVLSLDLGTPEAPLAGSAVVTAPAVVYASQTALYLATMDYRRGREVMIASNGGATGGTAVAGEPATSAPTATETSSGSGTGSGSGSGADSDDAPPVDTEQQPLEVDDRQATQLHKFDISDPGGAATYRASGRVYGAVLNSFSLGEHEDVLRVATTESRFDQDFQMVNHVFTLSEGDDEAGDRALIVLGQVADLAENERIYAVRFLGDRGFVVTFRQVDPLFTLDLSDPRQPRLIGELKVTGFSTYLHPLGEDHLLAIGEAANEDGRVTGMQLSIFDVSDFANPTLAHTQSLGSGYSDALYEHKAFTYWPADQLLAIPVESWEEQSEEVFQGLELYGVDVDAGFSERGRITHQNLDPDRPWAHIDRSLVIDRALYSVSNIGMKANAIEDLTEAAQCVFPENPNAHQDDGWIEDHGGPADGGREPMPATDVDDEGEADPDESDPDGME